MLRSAVNKRTVFFRPAFEPFPNHLALRSSNQCLFSTFMPHIYHLSRLCQGQPRSCSIRVPRACAVSDKKIYTRIRYGYKDLLLHVLTPQSRANHIHLCRVVQRTVQWYYLQLDRLRFISGRVCFCVLGVATYLLFPFCCFVIETM